MFVYYNKSGTYDAKVTTYGFGNCCVYLIKKTAITVSS